MTKHLQKEGTKLAICGQWSAFLEYTKDNKEVTCKRCLSILRDGNLELKERIIKLDKKQKKGGKK